MPYHVHVNQFDGPLDLLLHLIESAELDIKDIFLSEITTQYLAYMEQMDDLDMDTASEFLAMAATLLYIKSRQLLPRPPKEQLEEEDPEVLLIRQLKEYKLFKEAGEKLQDLQASAQGSFTRLPEEFALPEQEMLLSGATLNGLYQAFFTLLHAQPEQRTPHPLHQVHQDAFTIRSQIVKVRRLMLERGQIRFEELFEQDVTRLEIVVTFMAILEMLSRGEIALRQKEPFAPIRLRVVAIGMEDDDMDYMDEYTEQ